MWFEEVERLLAATPVRRKPSGNGFVASAVLVPLYVAAGELWVLLTRRTDSLPQHAGQYAFPGGVRTEGDEDEVATALRETHEELGIEPSLVVVLGQLSDVWTPTGFLISPVVGGIPHPLTSGPPPRRWRRSYRCSSRTLQTRKLWRSRSWRSRGRR